MNDYDFFTSATLAWSCKMVWLFLGSFLYAIFQLLNKVNASLVVNTSNIYKSNICQNIIYKNILGEKSIFLYGMNQINHISLINAGSSSNFYHQISLTNSNNLYNNPHLVTNSHSYFLQFSYRNVYKHQSPQVNITQ